MIFLSYLIFFIENDDRINLFLYKFPNIPGLFIHFFPYYGIFVIPAIPFIGLLSYKIDKLQIKDSLSKKSKSKIFDFFKIYFIKSFITLIFSVLVFYSVKLMHKTLKIGMDNIKEGIISWAIFTSIYIYLFYFVADKIISFYKRRKALKT